MNTSRLLALGALSVTVGFAFLASAQDKPKNTISDIMDKAHKGDTAIIRKAIAGNASPEELKSLAAYYKELSQLSPPKGDAASWKTKTTALVTASEKLAGGDKSAVAALRTASNCRACHTVHRAD